MNAKKLFMLWIIFAAILTTGLQHSFGESIDGRVIQVKLPAEDATLLYVEAGAVFTVALRTKSASVEAPKMFIGDGAVAIELVAHPTSGIFLQGRKHEQGENFGQGSTIRVRPGYRKASKLQPGDLYVVIPNVAFEVTDNRQKDEENDGVSNQPHPGSPRVIPLIEQTRNGVTARIEKLMIERHFYSLRWLRGPVPVKRQASFFVTNIRGESELGEPVPVSKVTFANDMAELKIQRRNLIGSAEQGLYLRHLGPGRREKIPGLYIGWIGSYDIPANMKVNDLFPSAKFWRTR